MRTLGLDHATINAVDVLPTVEFYEQIVGLRRGWRPPFERNGAWLYPEDGDCPILHILEVASPASGRGMVDHIAFRATGLGDLIEKLKASDIKYVGKPVPGTSLTQVHFHDPNGNKLELTFDEEVPPDLSLVSDPGDL